MQYSENQRKFITWLHKRTKSLRGVLHEFPTSRPHPYGLWISEMDEIEATNRAESAYIENREKRVFNHIMKHGHAYYSTDGVKTWNRIKMKHNFPYEPFKMH